MATRRDELSAHTFARKRTLAAFLQPESRVSDEEAPRPVRAMMPSMVMSVVLVAGFVAWGAIKPSAPKGWDEPGKHIIVDSKSTTRYVVLPKSKKDKEGQLHPVLNYASAKLVLDKGKGEVIEVGGEDIDKSSIARGATVGIPYAPDRLPDPKDAGVPKEWAVCEKPGAKSGGEPQRGVFVMGGQDKNTLKNKNRLKDGEGLYVEDSETGDQYVIDGRGTKLMLGGPEGKRQTANRDLLAELVLGSKAGQPQPVTTQWLDTFNEGEPITFEAIGAAAAGGPASFSGVMEIPADARQIGTVLKSEAAGTSSYYVVMKTGVQRTSPLVAKLMMGATELNQTKPVSVTPREAAAGGANSQTVRGGKGWPEDVLKPVNRKSDSINGTSRTVSCSVYTGKMKDGRPKLAAWAGSDYPANLVDGSASAYVSSGSGLLFREVSGQGGGGTQYLMTDSGLRYALASGGGGQQGGAEAEKGARARLGYEKTKLSQVPHNWASLIPKGPALDPKDASQEQGL
ncbi:type VII secretion protein EccB [Streptomyces sp. HNM0574]|uniref:type VII secretion protein EccB n=1 Tax=Streptomyces sp. HNM0574 TaxID=2714954 RepID=UPI00146C83A1|nr:type VII secretion protein EccB [Streptomyces sp. HNM0574]NLU69685.1 type VII secretion protein EccB [Streptomyces sp. HNM0574]